jgi:hypothetical protein
MAKSPVPVVVTPQAAVPLPTVAEFTAPMLAALTEALGANRGWSAWRRSSALCDNLSHFGSSRNSPKDNSGEAIKASGTARLSEELPDALERAVVKKSNSKLYLRVPQKRGIPQLQDMEIVDSLEKATRLLPSTKPPQKEIKDSSGLPFLRLMRDTSRILDEEYSLAERILDYGINHTGRNKDRDHRMMLVNYVNAIKLGGDKDRAINELLTLMYGLCSPV